MPTIKANKAQWTSYDWEKRGDEWSATWGNSDYLFWGAVHPRIMPFLPAGEILEIAPGFGRITRYLKGFCRRMTVVDLTPRCIEACQERFREERHITYHVNDGKSLAMVGDGSIDLAFSFDSLVHAEADVLTSYVHEIAGKLSAHGVGFIHHSNLGAFRDPATGELPFEAPHWRAASMTAELFRTDCEAAGLRCIAQELVNWGGAILHDCFSLFTRPGSPYDRPYELRENPGFMDEANALGALARQYGGAS